MVYRYLSWTSRILGSVLLLFLLWMLVGHLIGDANGANGMRFRNTGELIAFLFFPCTLIIGLALAYRWPLQGGSIALAGLLALFAMRPDLIGTYLVYAALPCLLYILHGRMQRGVRTQGA